MFTQERCSAAKAELREILAKHGIKSFRMVPVKRSYAFEDPAVPHGEQWVIKVSCRMHCIHLLTVHICYKAVLFLTQEHEDAKGCWVLMVCWFALIRLYAVNRLRDESLRARGLWIPAAAAVCSWGRAMHGHATQCAACLCGQHSGLPRHPWRFPVAYLVHW
jgi:hypothetical protein